MDKLFVEANDNYVGKIYMLVFKGDNYMEVVNNLKDQCKEMIV